MNRPTDRYNHLVDGGDALVRVDEQPFPVKPYRLNFQCRLGLEAIGR